jgi:hypothetical protein
MRDMELRTEPVLYQQTAPLTVGRDVIKVCADVHLPCAAMLICSSQPRRLPLWPPPTRQEATSDVAMLGSAQLMC